MKVTVGAVDKDVIRGALVEFLATTIFVFIGTGSVASTGTFMFDAETPADVGRLLPIATAFGLAITTLVYAFGHISGGHINPAVTAMLVLLDQCEVIRGVIYILAQLIGATLGSLLLWGCTSGFQNVDRTSIIGVQTGLSNTPPFNLGNNALNPNLNSGNGFLLEFMGTMLLCLTVAHTAVDGKSMAQGAPSTAPLAIGFAVLLAHIVLVPLTGCGINPARTFGPCLANSFAGENQVWENTWFYYVGPWTASVVAAGIYKALHLAEEPVEESKSSGGDEETGSTSYKTEENSPSRT